MTIQGPALIKAYKRSQKLSVDHWPQVIYVDGARLVSQLVCPDCNRRFSSEPLAKSHAQGAHA